MSYHLSASRSYRRRLHLVEQLEARRVLATFVVDTLVDLVAGDCTLGSGTCSVRVALQQAADSPDADRIEIPPGDYMLDSSLGGLTYHSDSDLEIVGTGTAQFDAVLDGGQAVRVLNFASNQTGNLGPSTQTVKLANLTIQHGFELQGELGDGIRADGLNIQLSDVTLRGNFDIAIYLNAANSQANLEIIRSEIVHNGTGIETLNANVSIVDTWISQNATPLKTNSVSFDPTIAIRNSTISENNFFTTNGLIIATADVQIENTTISDNPGYGGALNFVRSDYDSVRSGYGGGFSGLIRNSTITRNDIALGFSEEVSGAIAVQSTIITDDCSNERITLISLGNNIDQTGTCGLVEPSDLVVDPLLGPLQDNGGPVQTHALLPGSPAIDAAAIVSPATDARGVRRPQDGDANGAAVPDIGAYEVPGSGSRPVLVVDDASVEESAGTAVLNVRLSNGASGPFTVIATIIDSDGNTVLTQELTFSGAAEQMQTITYEFEDDDIVDLDEHFQAKFVSASDSGIDFSDTASLTILDDDSASLSIADVAVNESVGTAQVTVRLTGRVATPFTVQYRTADATAVAPSDYTAASGELLFESQDPAPGESEGECVDCDIPNETIRTFEVIINSDTVVEFDEIVNLQLFNVSNSRVLIGQPTDGSQLRILNDDTARLLIENVIVSEGDGTATVRVVLSGEVQDVFTVGAQTADETAISPDDYIAVNTDLVFSGIDGEVRFFAVTIVDDRLPEETEFIDLLFESFHPSVGVSGINYYSAEIVILDNDDVVATSSIVGQVSCDANGNGQADAGEASQNATVFVDRNGNGRLDPGDEEKTQTDSEGYYAFFDLAPGSVHVIAQVPRDCVTLPANPGVRRTQIDAGNLARSIVAEDVDGDGDKDLLVVSDGSSELIELRNESGVYMLNHSMPVGSRPWAIATWQPKPDVVGETSGLRAAGEGINFLPPTLAIASIGGAGSKGGLSVGRMDDMRTIPSGDGPVAVVIDDFNSDGNPDFATASFRSSDLHLHLSGNSASSVVATGKLIRAVAVGDANGDGFSDIAIVGAGYANDTTGQVGLLLGDGTGHLTAAQFTNSAREFVDVQIVNLVRQSDSQAGGVSQVILALAKSGQLVVLDSHLSIISNTDVVEGATAFDVGDFNRDGLLDVAIAAQGIQVIQFLVGNGAGRFVEVTRVDSVAAPSDLIVVDVDGDGFDEVAVTNLYGNIAAPGMPPEYRLPSSVTILQLDIAELPLVVSSEVISQIDFEFLSADPEVLFDVTQDGTISALDVLQVVNYVNLNGEGETTRTVKPSRTDVNGDGRTSGLDALLIINYINQPSQQRAEGEFAVMLNSTPIRQPAQRQPDSDAVDQWIAEFESEKRRKLWTSR